MKIYKRLLIVLGLLSVYSCEKELSITEFSDDFSNYEPELKIEALIFPTNNTAIVRVDKSFTLMDTIPYNCIDDDYGKTTEEECNDLEGLWHGNADSTIANCGDWNPDIHDVGIDGVKGDPSDDDGDCGDCSYGDSTCQENCREEDSIGENNGIPDCNEPNVDNYSELLPNINIQGDGCNIRITKINSDLSEEICEFTFDPVAGVVFDTRYTGSYESSLVDDIYEVNYGAYVPNSDCSSTMWANEDGSVNIESEYSFYADCSNAEGFENTSAITSKEPIRVSDPVIFVDTIINSPNENPNTQNKILQYIDNIGINNCTNYTCLYSDLKDEYKLLMNDEFVYFPRYSQPLSSYILWATISPNVYFEATQYMYDSTMTDKLYHGYFTVGTEFLNIVDSVCLMNAVIITDFYDGYGNGEWDDSTTDDRGDSAEIFVDENGNGEYDKGEYFIDTADGIGDIDTYYYEISTFSESYKNYYYYAQLLPNDPVRSNLRDQNMNPVMGTFGAISNNKINIQIIDCLEFTIDANEGIDWTYESQEDCENNSVTHGVCKWYDNKIIDFYNESGDLIEYDGDVCAPINTPRNFWNE